VLNRCGIAPRSPSDLDPCRYPMATPAILADRVPDLYGCPVSRLGLSWQVVGSSSPVRSRVLAARAVALEMEYQKPKLELYVINDSVCTDYMVIYDD
jgi:hypothetical protein